MERSYAYKGFAVKVTSEPIWEASRKVFLLAPSGYVALVQIETTSGTPLTGPIRLTFDDECPFASEGDALMGGFSAGQRIIDDLARIEDPSH